jgi:hypothetical protein
MKKHYLCFILAFSLWQLTASGNAQTRQETRRAALNALAKSNGVHEAAKISGGNFFLSDPFVPGFQSFTTLESLAASSDIAVIGIPVSSECRLSDNGRLIVTAYKFRIQDAVQGQVQPEDTITVNLPGGKFAFDDGVTAEIEVPNFRRMSSGHRYLIYLWASSSEKGVYSPTGGPNGMFELKADGKILPHGIPLGPEDPWAAKKDEDEQQFRDEVKFASRVQKVQRIRMQRYF